MLKYLFGELGNYFILLGKVFSKPDKFSIFYRQTIREFISVGVNSVAIVAIISFFMGAAVGLQTAYNT